MMGMLVSVFRSDYDSVLNAFHGLRQLCVVNIPGPFEPRAECPACELVERRGRKLIRPLFHESDRRHGAWVMFGGTFAYTSDVRFRDATGESGAIPIHDRIER